MTVNWNDNVSVSLTESGNEIYHRYLTKTYGPYALSTKHKPDEYGFTTFQIWELMEIFGNGISSGRPGPFKHGELHFDDQET